MAKQRYINDSFWTDSYVETLNLEEKLLFLYFLTNPLCNVAGIYEITESRIVYETKLSLIEVKKIKNKLVKDKKILIFKDWILFINFAKNQKPNPNVLIGMQRIIDTLPSEVKALKGFERLSHFTLLNLTLPNSTSTIVDDSITNNKKTMKTINYDTGEEVVKKEHKKMIPEQTKLAISVGFLWIDMVLKNTDLEKEEVPYNLVSKYARTYILEGWNYKEFENLFNYWFKTEKGEGKINPAFCFSKVNIAKYKQNKRSADKPVSNNQIAEQIKL